MGSPKKSRKKYSTPRHPWQGVRIEEEKELVNEYGLKNKKEIWKATSLLRNFKIQAKGKVKKPQEQIQKEQKLLLDKLTILNILPKGAKLDDVLGLTVKDILERRLQTLVFRQNLARSVKQARQFIIHGHIQVNNIKLNVPSYLINNNEEGKITFIQSSKLNDKEHPERVVIKKTELTKEAKKKEVEVQKKKVEDKEKALKPMKTKEFHGPKTSKKFLGKEDKKPKKKQAKKKPVKKTNKSKTHSPKTKKVLRDSTKKKEVKKKND